MTNYMKNIATVFALLAMLVCGLSEEAAAQGKKKNAKAKSAASTSTNANEDALFAAASGGGIKLNAKTIRVRIQTPRVKILLTRVGLDLNIDENKLEAFNDEIKERPRLMLYMRKESQRPIDIDEKDLQRVQR
jgi:cytochrome bd-type quinol oxidase subunit 1